MASSADFSPRHLSRVSPETALKFAVAASAVERRSLRSRSQTSSLAVLRQDATRENRERAANSSCLGRRNSGAFYNSDPSRFRVTEDFRDENSSAPVSHLQCHFSQRRASPVEARDERSESEDDDVDVSGEPRKKSSSGVPTGHAPHLLSRKGAERHRGPEEHSTPRVPLLTTKQQLLLLRYLCISNDEASRVLVQAAARQTGPVAGAAAVAARYLAAHQVPNRPLGNERRRGQELLKVRGVSEAPSRAVQTGGLEADSPRAPPSQSGWTDVDKQRTHGRGAVSQDCAGDGDAFPGESKGVRNSSGSRFRRSFVDPEGGSVRPARAGSTVRFRSPVATAETGEPRRLSERPLFPDETKQTEPNLLHSRGRATAEVFEPACNSCEACGRDQWESYPDRFAPEFSAFPASRATLRRTEGCSEERDHSSAVPGPCAHARGRRFSVSQTQNGEPNRFSASSMHADSRLRELQGTSPCEHCGPGREHSAVDGSCLVLSTSCHCPGTRGRREFHAALNASSSSSVLSCCSNVSCSALGRTAFPGDHACGRGYTRSGQSPGGSEARLSVHSSRPFSLFGATSRARKTASDTTRFSVARTSCQSCPSCTPQSPELHGCQFSSPGALGSCVDQACQCSSSCGACEYCQRSLSLKRLPPPSLLCEDHERGQGYLGTCTPAARPSVSAASTSAYTEGGRSSVSNGQHASVTSGTGHRQGPPVVRHRVFLRPTATAAESPGAATPVRRESHARRQGQTEERRKQMETRPFGVLQQSASSGFHHAGNCSGIGEPPRRRREAEHPLRSVEAPAQASSSLLPLPRHAHWESTRSSLSSRSKFLPSEELGPERAGVSPLGQVFPNSGGAGNPDERSMREASEVEVEGTKNRVKGGFSTVPSSTAASRPRSERGSMRRSAPVAERTMREQSSKEEGPTEDMHAVLEQQQRKLAEQLRLLDLIETQQLKSGLLGQEGDKRPGVAGSQPKTALVSDTRQDDAQENLSFLGNSRHLLHLDVEVVRRGRGKPWSVVQTIGTQPTHEVPDVGHVSLTKTEEGSHGLYRSGSNRVSEGNRLGAETVKRLFLNANDTWTTTNEQNEQQLKEVEDVVWTLAAAERKHANGLLRV
ncbi:UNVERIFIED_CONTAM: hypothetical protein HHA_263540 [Hammondia hammondi]|eukprot:XP_008887334.1 hypothetical protein HHA_263540 [Hammondia hammondi]